VKKTLPIERTNLIDSTECWTFEKLAIIQASPYAEDWLASHLNVFMDYDYVVSFGESYYKYPPSYYDDILTANRIDLFHVTEAVDTIKEHINQNRYVKYFRWLIFGYDDEQEHFFILMEKSKRQSYKLSYSDAEKALPKYQNEFGQEDTAEFGKEINRLHVSKVYQYPFIAYSINNNYTTDNCAYTALIKIDREIWGNKMAVCDSHGDYLNNIAIFYDGLACLWGLDKLVTLYLKNSENPERMHLARTIKKLHEHRCLLLTSLQYVQKKWNIDTPGIHQCIKTYRTCCNRFSKWSKIAIKYELTHEKQLLYTIAEKIDSAYMQEKDTLLQFRGQAYEWYNKHCIS